MTTDVVPSILDAMRKAADPSAVTRSFCERVFLLHDHVRVLSVGKAGVTMMQAGLEVFGDRVSAGLAIAPEEQCVIHSPDPRVRYAPSDHPLPTERSVAAAEAMLSFVGEGDEPLVVLLSGGGSAMTAKPADGVSLDDLRAVADGLMRAGATIDELNCVRKHLDLAKGGRVGVATNGRMVAVGVMSDVLGDRLDVISSGPFVGDGSTFAEASRVLDRTRVRVPGVDAVIDRGAAGKIKETPKPADKRLAAIVHEVLASNSIVARAAADAVEGVGVETELRTGQSGEASAWSAAVAERLRAGPGAMVLGGESVVSDVPRDSEGGPVQEAVLAAGHALRDVPDWLVIGYATDGVDGPTDAAGAVLTPGMLPEARRCERALSRHRSYRALRRADALINTGPTGTNLNDVLIGIRWPV
ncbi:MAG: DUF4147 domain-containing protein [Planctomycetota bacterium]